MRQVRWGVLGTAGIARGQTIPGMRLAQNCRLYAIAGRSLDKARQFQAEFGFEKVYDDYEALLRDPQVQAVYIPLPNDLHAPWVKKALESGKHVLCEKPLALNAREAEALFDAAEKNGVCLMEAFAYLHSPIVAALQKEIADGAVGQIHYIESSFIGGLPRAEDYRMRKEAGGGAAYDLGCYGVSMALALMGREPEQVRAVAQFHPRGVDVFTSALLLYDDGALAHVDCGMLPSGGRIDRLVIRGERGEITSPVAFNQAGDIPYTVARDGRRETKWVHAPNNYQLEVEQLGRCVLNGEKPAVSRDFSLMAARVTDRILDAIGF